MEYSILVARLALALLGAIGFLGTLKFAAENGTFARIEKRLPIEGPLLQGSRVEFFLTKWTGETAFDSHICIVMMFWRAILDGSLPSASLSAVYYFGQHLALWFLIMIEGYRVGNKWTIVSFITIIGLVGENIGMATIIPLYFALHLSSSPTVRFTNSYPPAARKTMLLVHPTELQALPWSIAIGYGVPTALIFFCKFRGDGLTYATKQFWIIIRQMGPLLVSTFQLILSIFFPPSEVAKKPPNERNSEVMEALETTYTVAAYIGEAVHISVMTLMGASQIIPSIFAAGYKSYLHPRQVLKPVMFWHNIKISNISGGVLYFFQWTNITAFTSLLIWAITLNRHMASNRRSSFVRTVFKTASLTVLAGPVTAAVALVMERDQMMLYDEEDDLKKDT